MSRRREPVARWWVAMLVALANAFVLVPLACVALDAPPFALGNMVAFVLTYVSFRSGLANVGDDITAVWNGVAHGPLRHPRPEPFDTVTARRATHALGLPFPEADGSLSWPCELDPRSAEDAAYEALYGDGHD